MTAVSRLLSVNARPSARVITAPQQADVLTGAFRSAFPTVDEVPAEFRSILARLDAQ